MRSQDRERYRVSSVFEERASENIKACYTACFLTHRINSFDWWSVNRRSVIMTRSSWNYNLFITTCPILTPASTRSANILVNTLLTAFWSAQTPLDTKIPVCSVSYIFVGYRWKFSRAGIPSELIRLKANQQRSKLYSKMRSNMLRKKLVNYCKVIFHELTIAAFRLDTFICY